MMRPLRLLLFAGAVHASVSMAAEVVTLNALESLVNVAPAVRLAEADRFAAERHQEVALAAASPRLFASGTVGRFTDPSRPEHYRVQNFLAAGTVDEFNQRLTPQGTRHSRYGALIGVRMPLFGSREVVVRDLDSAKGNVALLRIREQVSRMEALKALRYAYVEAYYRDAQSRLAQAYLGGEEQANRLLLPRQAAHVLLEADRKGIEATYFSARQIATQTRAAGNDAVDRLQILSGRPFNDASLEAPAFSIDCIGRAAVENAIATHPDILFHAAQLEQKRRLLASSGVGLTEGGVSLSHGRANEFDGGHGHSTALSVDISIPLFARQWRRAQRGEAQAEVSKAELMLDLRRQEYLASLGKLFGELDSRRQHLRLVRQRLDTSKEVHRVASLRSDKLEEDVHIHLLQAKFNAYTAANDHLEAEIALDKAEIDVLGYGLECKGRADKRPDVSAEVYPILTQAVAGPGRANAVAASPIQRQTPMQTALWKPSDAPMIGWYAWNTFKRFEATTSREFWSALPATGRLLLSLSGKEIEAVLHDGPQATRLQRFLESAEGRGTKVELLLADPNWALPTASADLISLVRSLSHFHFAGLHLDLERMQLAEDRREAWPDGIVDTVAKLRSATALPISLSMHPRDAQLEDLLQRLQEAGLNEVTFMAFMTNPQRVAALLAPIFRLHPRLRFSVAQSVEPILPEEESYAHLSRNAGVTAWRELADRLRKEPNFSGILIQSLEDYVGGAPNEN